MTTEILLDDQVVTTLEEAQKWSRVIKRCTERPVSRPVCLSGTALEGRWSVRLRHRRDDLRWVWLVLELSRVLSIDPQVLAQRLQQAARKPRRRSMPKHGSGSWRNNWRS